MHISFYEKTWRRVSQTAALIKAPTKVVVDGNVLYLLLLSEEIRFDISCESSALADDSHEISSLIFP